jgi:TPR repeat protein
MLSRGREVFDFFKKSAEGGCSWGQVQYGWCFKNGWNVEKDKEVYLEWLEKSANQNNPWAIQELGDWFQGDGDDKEKAVSYHRTAAELGWKDSMYSLAVC